MIDTTRYKQILNELDAEQSRISEALYHMTPWVREGVASNGYVPYKSGGYRFTGWKWDIQRQGSDGGFVAQWTWKNNHDQSMHYYVNLPNFNRGSYTTGDSFAIGSHRVTGDEPEDKIQSMVTEGKRLLLEMVDAYHVNTP